MDSRKTGAFGVTLFFPYPHMPDRMNVQPEYMHPLSPHFLFVFAKDSTGSVKMVNTARFATNVASI